jgi:hypothetical protein
MSEKPVSVKIDFNEALRRIAHTPKEVVKDSAKKLVNDTPKVYNSEKATAKPPSGKRKPT